MSVADEHSDKRARATNDDDDTFDSVAAIAAALSAEAGAARVQAALAALRDVALHEARAESDAFRLLLSTATTSEFGVARKFAVALLANRFFNGMKESERERDL